MLAPAAATTFLLLQPGLPALVLAAWILPKVKLGPGPDFIIPSSRSRTHHLQLLYLFIL